MSPTMRVAIALAIASAFLGTMLWAQTGDTSQRRLKDLTLEQLGNLEVVTRTKAPEQLWKTPAAVFVITQEDIHRAGVTSLPEALRLAPGVEVERISADKWSIWNSRLQQPPEPLGAGLNRRA